MFDRDSNYRLFSCKVVFVFLLAASQGTAATRIWDTMSPSLNEEVLADRSGWKVVPTETDRWNGPEYYSPERYAMQHSFRGDAVVENEHLVAVFSSRKAKAIIYSKADPAAKKVEVVPLEFKAKPARITHFGVLRNSGDEAALEVVFSGEGTGKTLSLVFSFGNKRIVEIAPSENVNGISLLGPIRYGVAPDFISDDLILDLREYPSLSALYVPSGNLFVGLLEGENDMLIVTWPAGKQRVRLVPDTRQREPRLIESVDIENDGKSVFLAVSSATGIWHEEVLKASYLEKDIAIAWKRPFPAKWITQLLEDGVETTFTFRESRPKRFWRGGIGSYTYPVWFRDGTTFYRLGKKIPPKGKSLVYFLERKGTPASVLTPVDIMKDTLGGQTCSAVLDLEGRRPRSHRRKDAVIGAATCGVTDGMQPVFDAGKEAERKEYIHGGVDDMVYFITRQRQRINEYQAFAGRMIKYLDRTGKARPDLKPFIDNIRAITQEIIQEHDRQRENMKTLAYADELARETKALTLRKDPGNPARFTDLKMKWRRMGGTQDYLVCKFHTITRKLFQQAGYGCIGRPEAVAVADEIRNLCRQCLRNPDGYEIWPDY
ncbi:MAG: hypothetical protein CEE38_08385 [Planctomycetes bacterium B3_Pla]|nr:MAG: hypothetical protein CEE38_08385 [Planctomycetes bacterium B3_Pla]